MRLELAAADCHRSAGQQTAAALALARAAELLTRFSGMFAAADESLAEQLLDQARSLAPLDDLVSAAITVVAANSKAFTAESAGRWLAPARFRTGGWRAPQWTRQRSSCSAAAR